MIFQKRTGERSAEESLISMTMEPTICAPFRFISAERSLRAR